VCLGTSYSTTASDDPSSSVGCIVCVGRFHRGVPGGGRYAPPWLRSTFDNRRYPRADGVQGSTPKFFLGSFCYF
jgi:hypothetical protein